MVLPSERWLMITDETGGQQRRDSPILAFNADGILEVNGERVMEKYSLPCGFVVLATETGAAILSKEEFVRLPQPTKQGLASDLQA